MVKQWYSQPSLFPACHLRSLYPDQYLWASILNSLEKERSLGGPFRWPRSNRQQPGVQGQPMQGLRVHMHTQLSVMAFWSRQMPQRCSYNAACLGSSNLLGPGTMTLRKVRSVRQVIPDVKARNSGTTQPDGLLGTAWVRVWVPGMSLPGMHCPPTHPWIGEVQTYGTFGAWDLGKRMCGVGGEVIACLCFICL